MESALRHIGNLISKGGDGSATVYLQALNDHINANTSQRDLIHVLDSINFLLSKAKTRLLGLQLLDKMLPWVNQEMLEQKIQHWTSFILKACNQDELQKYGGLIYRTLTNLALVLRQYAELSKSFASNYLTKVYEAITLSPAVYYSSALKCAEAYLSTYTKPNGQSRDAMERFLKIFPDLFDDEVNHYAGRCLHYLQLTTTPGSKDIKAKEQWKLYQLQLIDNLSAILNDAYADYKGLPVAEGSNDKNFSFPALKLSSEPDVRAAQLYVRFHNLSNYLKIAVCEPNPTSKSILPKRILNLITRGLVITCAALNQDATYSKIALGVFLPKIQFDLLELSKALIRTLHSHLRIYYKSLLSCLVHVLKSTTSSNKALRAQVYNVITLWCETLSDGSGCELYADELIPEVLKDVSPVKNELVSQVKPKEKHKKAYQPLNTKESSSKGLERSNQTLFGATPIVCLRAIVTSCSCFLKPTMVTRIQTAVLKISASFFATKRIAPYNNWQNRLEMYKLLHTLLTMPCQHSPPPSQIVLYILNTALNTETNAEIRQKCYHLLEDAEKIIHPQKESLIIPIEARVIRNAFIKLGQETLLEQSYDAISKLKYSYDDNNTKELPIASYSNGENTTAAVETYDFVVEHIDDSDEPVNELPLTVPTVTKISNGNHQSETMQSAEDEPPQAKKLKFDEIVNESAETSESCEDSESEIENLQPATRRQQSSNNATSIQTSKPNQEKLKAEKSTDDQTLPEKPLLAKNEEDEIAEMEAFFVDELKGGF